MSYAKYNGLAGSSSGSGTVSTVSVVTANGLAGTVANPTTTPAITLSTTVTGLLKGDGTTISAQTTGNLTDAGTDGITVTGGTGSVLGSGTSIAQHVADTTHNGYLSSTDWNTFNSKQASLTIGNLTDAGTDGITVTGGTGSIIGSGTSIAQHVSDSTHNGYLSSTDWSTFNGKQSALTIGNLTDAGTDGIVVTSGTGAVIGSGTSIAQHVADSTHNGYLSSTDWSTFNGKQASGSYITALTGDVAASGPGSSAATLATVNSNVGSFTYSSITVNAKGLITAASSGSAPLINPMNTGGDIIYGGASGTPTRLANGSSAQVLSSSGGTSAPTWVNAGRITAWSSWTPTVVGFGATSISGTYRQVGNSYECVLTFAIGTATAVIGSVTIPNGGSLDTGAGAGLTITANTTGAVGTPVGQWAETGTGSANDTGFIVTAPGTNASLVYFGGLLNAINKLIPQNGSAIVAGAGTTMGVRFTVPISGAGGTTA